MTSPTVRMERIQYKETLSQITQVQVDPNGVYFPFATNVFEFAHAITNFTRPSGSSRC